MLTIPDCVNNNSLTRVILHYSPFMVPVKPGADPGKVKVYGEGVRPSGVLASIPTNFTVDTREAGNAELEVNIKVSKVKQVTWQHNQGH